MPIDATVRYFDRRDPILSEMLDELDRMLIAKLERGHAELLDFAKGNEDMAKALKTIIASLVSCSMPLKFIISIHRF